MDLGEFVVLTLSGLVVNVAGIVITALVSHAKLKSHLDQRTDRQTTDIEVLTAEQTAAIEHLTEAQTAELLGRRKILPVRTKKRART